MTDPSLLVDGVRVLSRVIRRSKPLVGERLAAVRGAFRARLRTLRRGLQTLHRLARHHVERGEHPAAILLCQRALVEESCDEESHQMLMACYMVQGLRHLAVRQFQIYHGLDKPGAATGELDDRTRLKLKDVHGA